MDAIRGALESIRDLVNTYLENLDRRGDDWVVLTSIVDHDGSLNQDASNKIVMSAYNFTRETVTSTFQPALPPAGSRSSSDGMALISAPLYLDVHVMFMANFTESSYPDGLAALSRLIAYFQQTPLFTHDNAPMLAPEITKLTMEFENLNPVDVNYVMGMLGTHYLPSAFYKLRMIPFASTAMRELAYAVHGTGVNRRPPSALR